MAHSVVCVFFFPQRDPDFAHGRWTPREEGAVRMEVVPELELLLLWSAGGAHCQLHAPHCPPHRVSAHHIYRRSNMGYGFNADAQ